MSSFNGRHGSGSIMRITIISVLKVYFLLTAQDTIAQDADKIVISSPEDVGLGHTRIIQNLQETFRTKLPKNNVEFLRSVFREMSYSICGEGETACHHRIANRLINPIRDSRKGVDEYYTHVKFLLPNDFDPEVHAAMKKLLSSNATFEESDEALSLMYRDMQALRHSTTVKNEDHRELGLTAFSVGMESAKQWYEILSDPLDPFNNMLEDEYEGNRRLQFEGLSTEELTTNLLFVVKGDVVGAIDGSLSGLIDASANKTVLSHALDGATLASISEFSCVFVGLCNEPGDGVVGALCEVTPTLPWCSEDDGDGNSTSTDVPAYCAFFPNRPACLDESDEGENDYCPFPELEDCGLNLDDQEDSGDGSVICSLTPSLPICQNGGGDSGGDSGDSGGDIPAICNLTPNLPICQNNNSPSSEEVDVESEDGEGGTPTDLLCQEFPNLPSCQDDGSGSNIFDNGDNTPPSAGETGAPAPALPTGGETGAPASAPVALPTEECPFPNLPSCGVIPDILPEDNAFCDRFPNNPIC